MTLPTEAKGREQWPIYDYQYGYFPDAYLEEVRVAWVGNQQHNPGEKMHWARDKSPDHMNKAMRHIDDYARGIKRDTDGTCHLAKAVWRIKAQLQLDLEAERKSREYVEQETQRAAAMAEQERLACTIAEPLYVLYDTRMKAYWRSPGDGTTDARAKAHRYTRAEAAETIADIEGIVLEPA